ncbi:MAG TPA: PstS family phosphate ABC transporter substrate-binding protein [Myxococcota bacterium]|nr:PstS family phosphate ABC transporter substrate-binding protein [Myxococcota bacterium]
MLRGRLALVFALGWCVLRAEGAQAAEAQVEAKIAAYQKVSGIAGNLSAIGSDTLNNVMSTWAEGFRKEYPSVQVQVEGKGSSTAPPALIAGTAQLAPMSREMKADELDAFEKKFGYPPTQIRVAIDALAVYVHKDNPLDKATLAQVDAVFSKSRRCGNPASIENWGDLGVKGGLASQPIRLYGRNSASGTYGYFKEVALCGGDYRDTVKEQPGSSAVVQGVTEDKQAMGYSGIGYKTAGVKTLSLAKDANSPYSTTEPEEVYAGKYPLARFLYVYVNRPPGKALDPLTLEFMRFALSHDGQEDVKKEGYLPLKAATVEQELAKLR